VLRAPNWKQAGTSVFLQQGTGEQGTIRFGTAYIV